MYDACRDIAHFSSSSCLPSLLILINFCSLFCFFQLKQLLPPFFFFFFNDTATTEIYTLSLHDALPILGARYIVPFSATQTPLCKNEAFNESRQDIIHFARLTRKRGRCILFGSAAACLS